MPPLRRQTFACLLTLTGLTATAAAQRMPVPAAGDRVLQLFDLQSLRQQDDPDAEPDLAGDAIAAMLRPFVEPALGPGDDLRPLGDRWLVLLGSPAQIACVERMFQQARSHRDDIVDVQVRFFECTATAFHQQLEPQLKPIAEQARESYRVVLSKADAPAFLAAATQHGELLLVPRIAIPWLVPASVDVVEQIAYVKDYELTFGPENAIADPVIDSVWSGQRGRLCAVLLPNGNIGLRCDIRHQQVDRPLAETEVELVPGVAPVKVQLPRVTGVHLESVAELQPGSMIVVTSRRSDGRFLVAAVTAELLHPR